MLELSTVCVPTEAQAAIMGRSVASRKKMRRMKETLVSELFSDGYGRPHRRAGLNGDRSYRNLERCLPLQESHRC